MRKPIKGPSPSLGEDLNILDLYDARTVPLHLLHRCVHGHVGQRTTDGKCRFCKRVHDARSKARSRARQNARTKGIPVALWGLN